MRNAGILLGFAPWIVFAVLSGPSTWEWGALTAFVVTLVLAVPDWRRTREVNVLDVTGIAFFGVLSVLTFVLEREDLQWVEDRAQLLSSLVLTLVAVVSLAIGRPFTEYYARQDVPREYWTSPLFRRVNVVITAVWAAAFALTAACDLVVLSVPGSGYLLNWVLPVLIIVAAVRFTIWYPQHARARAGLGNDREAAS